MSWIPWRRRSRSILQDPVDLIPLPGAAAAGGGGAVVSLGWQELLGLPPSFAERHSTCEHLDLSHNLISSATFLSSLPRIRALVLDHNGIADAGFTWPRSPIPSLNTLWLNHNRLADGAALLRALATAFPNLRHLSLLRNPLCRSYARGPAMASISYRCFVISALEEAGVEPESLDGSSIDCVERQQARDQRAPRAAAPQPQPRSLAATAFDSGSSDDGGGAASEGSGGLWSDSDG